MKKLILSLMLAILSSLGIYAQNYSMHQKEVIAEISSYLRGNDYSVEEKPNGLKFKSDGVTYYVEVSHEDKNPMFVSLKRYIQFGGSIKRANVISNLEELNKSFGVKVIVRKNEVVLSSEMFISESSHFTDAFNTMFTQIKSVYKEIHN